MKDAEIRRMALGILWQEHNRYAGYPLRWPAIALIEAAQKVAALEANPPLEAPVLAEVEGQLVLGGDGNYRMGVCFRAEDVFVLDSTNPIPVTVTIRGRGDVPEPPATSSSVR